MSERLPFRLRPALQWQLVLVNPTLLRAAQRRLRASGPSHAIEEARDLRPGRRRPTDEAARRRLFTETRSLTELVH